MHLWKNRDGVPGVADAVLVCFGPFIAIAPLSSTFDPILDFFEPQGAGFGYFGYVLIFLMLGVSAGSAGILIWKTQVRVRPEIQAARVVFAFVSPVFAAVSMSLFTGLLPIRFFFEYDLLRKSPAVLLAYGPAAVMMLLASAAYLLTARAAQRHPVTTNRYLIYFVIALSLLEVAAKIARLIARI